MKEGYVPSRCDHWPGCPDWIKFNPSSSEHRLDPHRLAEMFNPTLFEKLFPGVDDVPPYFAGTCCSQFAVTRETIRSNPIETYQRLFDWIMEYQYDDRSGMVFEYTWPYIFLGRGTLCPTMQQCYCKTYNLCMEDQGDVEELTHWNDLRTRREEVKWQAAFMDDAMETRQRDYEEKGLSSKQILEVEEAFEPEVYRLNAELERLVNNTWLARERIIKKYKLPTPPVGW